MVSEASILMRMEKPARPQLDRAAWTQAALDTLADEGVTGIRVEVLFETQSTCGVTVVDPTSSDPGMAGVIPIPVDADHISICKPASKAHLVFARTKLFIEKVLGR